MSSMSYPTETPAALTLTITTTTSNREPIDPRAFVECSHVETELLEDSLESPSLEALQRCRDFGVTYDELHRGISRNSHIEQTKVDVGNFYVSCQNVFDGNLDYLTNELKEDYRRCKRMRVLSRETQMKVEEKFFEALYDETGGLHFFFFIFALFFFFSEYRCAICDTLRRAERVFEGCETINILKMPKKKILGSGFLYILSGI